MIRLLIADDHAVVRQGVRQILADYADMVLVGEAATGNEVMQCVREQVFDILVLDMSMPGRCGVELIKQIKAERPMLPILIFSMHEELQYAVRVLKAGASGYLVKNGEPQDLIAALRKLVAGGHYFSPAVAEKLVEDTLMPQGRLPHERLTDREFQVFELLVEGKTLTTIADDLCLSVKTVSTHKHNIVAKMGLTNRTELVRYALEYKLEGIG